MNPHLEHLSYQIQVWSSDGKRFHQTIAASQNLRIAEAAVAAAITAYPTCRIQLHDGLRLLEDRPPSVALQLRRERVVVEDGGLDARQCG